MDLFNQSSSINFPKHQVRHICKARKANTQKPTLQKSLPCANTLATLCGATQTHNIDDRVEGRTYNRGFAKIRADGSFSAFCNSIVLHIGQDIHYLAFVCYLQFFNHHRYRADGILIPVLRQALSVVCHFTDPQIMADLTIIEKQ